jgi:hypothetical protein
MSLAAAGTALILMTGCVSSKKYHASQAETAKLRSDSTQQAQQISSLNGNVTDLQGKNSNLQQSLEASNSKSAATQKSLDYYQGYFKEQQGMMSQVSDDVKGALTQAGINNGDIQQVNNTIYVRISEDDLFKKNSTVVTTSGKQALNNLAGVIKARSNVNVFVGANDSAIAVDNSAAATAEMTPKPVVHHRHHSAASKSAASGGTGAGTGAAANSTAANSSTTSTQNTGTPVHHKVHHRPSSEGSMAIYNKAGHNRAWSLKQGRMVMVANSFLQSGIPKINVSLQQPPQNGAPDNMIKVVFTPKMEDFNPSSVAR